MKPNKNYKYERLSIVFLVIVVILGGILYLRSNVHYLRSEAQFNKLIQGTQPILVSFYADWCAPCKLMSKALSKVKIKTVKVNINKFPSIANKYAVTSIPSLFLFQSSKIINQHVGVLSKDELDDWIKDSTDLFNRLI